MDATGGIVTTNEAVFGFGPLGSWALAIDGTWKNMGDGRSVKVGACFIAHRCMQKSKLR